MRYGNREIIQDLRQYQKKRGRNGKIRPEKRGGKIRFSFKTISWSQWQTEAEDEVERAKEWGHSNRARTQVTEGITEPQRQIRK